MRPSPSTQGLCQNAVRRLIRLRSLVDQANFPVDAELERLFSFAAIETMNLWTGFARSYYLSCAFGARDVSGTRITTAARIKSEEDAIGLAIAAARPDVKRNIPPWQAKDEPAWHDTTVFLKVMGALNPSNLACVRDAFGYRTRVFRDLPVFRNYYAHKGRDTARRVRSAARQHVLDPSLRPTEVLCSRRPGSPQTLLADWMDEMRRVIQLMP